MPMEEFTEFIMKCYQRAVTDVHIRDGHSCRVRIGGELRSEKALSYHGDNLKKLIPRLIDEEERRMLSKNRSFKGMYNFSDVKIRYNISFDRDQLYMVIRILPMLVRTWEMLEIPKLALNFLVRKQGLILISGPLNSGKTSTLASFTEYLNNNRREHIIFIDEVIEHKIQSKRCIVNLRQLGSDTLTYTTALKYALREDPDIIVLGDINSHESAEIAINIAETGHLVIAGVSTVGALNTVQRVLNCFPASQLENARLKLSAYLIGIISQVLVPDANGVAMVPAFEVMTVTPPIQNNIRSEKTNQLKAEFSRSVKGVSICFEDYAKDLKAKGLISADFDMGKYLGET